MANETAVYEQRQVSLRIGGLAAYASNAKDQVWPDLNREGARVLSLLNGFIGEPRDEVIQITRFPDRDTWNDCQNIGAAGEDELVEKEKVRLLKPIASRPEECVPPDDRRAVYGFRRQLIRSKDLEEFAHGSENGVWPRIRPRAPVSSDCAALWRTPTP